MAAIPGKACIRRMPHSFQIINIVIRLLFRTSSLFEFIALRGIVRRGVWVCPGILADRSGHVHLHANPPLKWKPADRSCQVTSSRGELWVCDEESADWVESTRGGAWFDPRLPSAHSCAHATSPATPSILRWSCSGSFTPMTGGQASFGCPPPPRW